MWGTWTGQVSLLPLPSFLTFANFFQRLPWISDHEPVFAQWTAAREGLC